MRVLSISAPTSPIRSCRSFGEPDGHGAEALHTERVEQIGGRRTEERAGIDKRVDGDRRRL